MKKLLGVILLIMSFAAVADESYLYWMLSGENEVTWTSLEIKAQVGDTSSALTIYDWWGDDKESLGTSISSGDYEGMFDEDGNAPQFFAYLTDGSVDMSSYTFVIELYNESQLVASSDSLSYSAASSYIQYNDGMAWETSASVYTFEVVPEPTSGLLVLIGGALLSLRRKRKLVV